MSGALGFLLRRTLRHRAAAQLRRLAEPRYAVAAALGLVYLGTLMARPPRAEFTSEAVASLALAAGSLGLAAWTAWAWTIGHRSRLATFSRPELTFLAGGPVTTGRLLGYKLLRGQHAVVPNAALWALLLGWSGGGFAAWREFPAAWLLLTTVQLHHLVATLGRGSPAHGRRHWPVELAAAAAAVVGALLLGSETWPVVQRGLNGGLAGLPLLAQRALAEPAVRVLLFPFRVAVAPLAAPSVSAWAASLPAAALLLAGHVAVLFAARETFRRTAVERSSGSERAARGRSAALVRLAPAGAPALAVTWKNVNGVVRRRRVAAIGVGIAVIAVAAVAAGRVIDPIVPQAVAAVSAVWAAAFILLGPQWVRNDLRTDLLHLAVVRSWPLSGRTIAAAEVLASTLLLTAAQLALLFIAAATALSSGLTPLDGDATGAVVLLLGALPLLNWLHLVVHNALAVLYPGWVPLGPQPRTGIEGLGQQAIVLVAGLGGLTLLLVPVAAAAGAAWSVSGAAGATEPLRRLVTGCIAAPAAILVSLLVLRLAGTRLERLEPADLDEADQARG